MCVLFLCLVAFIPWPGSGNIVALASCVALVHLTVRATLEAILDHGVPGPHEDGSAGEPCPPLLSPCVHGPLVSWGSAAEPGRQDEPCQLPAWWAAAPGTSRSGISAAEKLGQVRSGGGRALVSSWGDLLRAGGCRPPGTGALAAGGSCPVLSSPPLRCEPSRAWGHQLQPPRGKGASPCIKLGSSPFFPQRREEKAAPLGVSGSCGFLQRRKTPGPRPLCPSWPLQRSAPAGSCF